MTTRRFAPLFWCQFFAAFGDNFLKTSLVFVILFQVAGADSEALITLAGATLIAPFFFLSGLGGEPADRYDKPRWRSDSRSPRSPSPRSLSPALLSIR
jgi:acyl-[acyl-carrier-protein]-phospholipid O-acyltransferase/long-chain-fatty-acid--[acyl-carrier-protein] ligase